MDSQIERLMELGLSRKEAITFIRGIVENSFQQGVSSKHLWVQGISAPDCNAFMSISGLDI